MRRSGFTLAEMAIVLAVMTLVMITVFNGSRAALDALKQKQVKDRLDVIRNAMINHIARTHRLPCPARSNSTTGTEATWTAGANMGNCAGLTSFNNTYGGIVPWATLGLSQEMANDAWNHRLTYTVSRTALLVDGYRRNGTITVHSTAPIALGAPPAGNQMNVGNNAIAMLVSHGKNGFGTWAPGGTAMPPPPGTLEGENTPTNTSFVQATFDDTNPANPFDDLLVWFSAGDVMPQLQAQLGETAAEAVTRERLNRLRDAFMGTIVNSAPAVVPPAAPNRARFPTPANVGGLIVNPFANCTVGGTTRAALNVTNTVALAIPTLPAELQRDGWGQTFIYTYRTASHNAFDKNTGLTCPAIQIRSRGPNETSGNAANEADDIVLNILETDISARLP